MPHWTGQHRSPRPLPPYPQPPGTNDIYSRVSRLEVHQWHSHQDMDRIETESLMRGKDLASDIKAMAMRLDAMEGHIGTARTLAKWGPAVLRFLAAIMLFGLFLAGKLSVAEIKTLLPGLVSGGG